MSENKKPRLNHLAPSGATLTKSQAFAFIDSYFQEGQCDIAFEVSADDVRRHLKAEIDALPSFSRIRPCFAA